MSSSEKGEHSRKNESTDDEKPLKKARYVWEVKGKYHLKETYKNNNNNLKITQNPPEDNQEVINNDKDHATDKTEVNKPCCSSKDFVQSILSKTDAIFDDELDDQEISNRNLDCNISKEIPVTLVSPKPNRDWYMHKWQARQIARGFVDNTINTVLDTWKDRPADIADLVENCDNDGQVEDDAILMAIQSHGLQSNCRGSLLNDGLQGSVTASCQDVEESAMDNFENFQNELIKEQEASSVQSIEPDSMSCDSNSNSSDNRDDNLDIMEDPMDFLNAAVSVAIQKKGLSYGY